MDPAIRSVAAVCQGFLDAFAWMGAFKYLFLLSFLVGVASWIGKLFNPQPAAPKVMDIALTRKILEAEIKKTHGNLDAKALEKLVQEKLPLIEAEFAKQGYVIPKDIRQ